MRSSFDIVSIAIALCGLACHAASLTPPHEYEKIYGDSEREALATPSREDDIKFAASLLKGADQLPDSPDVRCFVLKKCVEFAMVTRAGYPTAREALSRLKLWHPVERAFCETRELKILEDEFNATSKQERSQVGYELAAWLIESAKVHEKEGQESAAVSRLEYAVRVCETLRRKDDVIALQGHIGRLQCISDAKRRRALLVRDFELATQQAPVARSICLLDVTELNDPASAAPFVGAACDPELTAMVALARKEPDTLDERDAMQLGDWYFDLGVDKDRSIQAIVWNRAIALYGEYLDKHAAGDAERLRVLTRRDELNDKLTKVAHVSELGRATSFLGLTAPGSRIAYIVDVSGSMAGPKLSTLKTELLKSIESSKGQTHFFIAPYNSELVLLDDRKTWTAASSAGKKWASGQVRDLEAMGGTAPLPAFDVVFKLKPRPDAIFFVTDGLFTEDAPQRIQYQNTLANRIPIHCIAFDVEDRMVQTLMRDIAQTSGGQFSSITANGAPR